VPPQRKPQTASDRANEALDRVTSGATPARRTLDFLLKGSHDEPGPESAQSQPEPSPIQTQPEPRPKLAQSQPNPRPIAPERNYNKRANSLEHSALPSGLFPGASKKIYDALYVRTRGAINATRTVQAKHRELMAWANIKDVKTVKTHLNKLREQGLVAWHTLKGEHEGSFYEVFLPEEVSPDLAQAKATPSPILKTDSDQAQNLDWVGLPKVVDSQRASELPKTSSKTKERNTDDEAFAKLRAAAKEITGKEATDWQELDEVLTTELRIAAGRTTVSSVPAFLAEHLRRRLWKTDKARLDASGGPVEAQERASGGGAGHKVDASKCPACFGTGMFYPEGFDKGVTRCDHPALRAELSKTEEK
jgi:hypothetical protein